MEIQAVNPAGNPTAPKPRSSSSSPRSEAGPVSDPKPSRDAVDLSSQGQVLAKTGKSGQTSLNSEQRKFSVTDDNDVVLLVIDPKTQEVVRSVPSEEEIQLRSAIRDGVNEITE